jgi:hypothetical protein
MSGNVYRYTSSVHTQTLIHFYAPLLDLQSRVPPPAPSPTPRQARSSQFLAVVGGGDLVRIRSPLALGPAQNGLLNCTSVERTIP